MNDRKLTLLARQLKQQAKSMESGNDNSILLSLVATSNTLMEAVISALEGEKLTPSETDQLNSLYYKHSLLSEKAMNNEIGRLKTETGKPEFSGIMQKNADAREQMQKLREEIEGITSAAEMLRTDIEETEAKKNEAKAELESLKVKQRAITELMEDCSPEKIGEQRRLNAELQTRYTEALKEQEQLRTSNEKLKKSIDEVDDRIAGIPDENRRLLKEYEEKTELLNRLRSADTECSQEVQDELTEQIDSLQPDVEKKQHAVSVLRSRYEDLEFQRKQWHEEQSRLSKGIFDRIFEYLSAVESDLVDEEDRLSELKSTADIFMKRTEVCLNNRRKYASWLESDKNPLESMMLMLDRAEAEQLKQTLDIGSINSIKKLTKETEGNLQELDKILDKCMKAVNLDQKRINSRARR